MLFGSIFLGMATVLAAGLPHGGYAAPEVIEAPLSNDPPVHLLDAHKRGTVSTMYTISLLLFFSVAAMAAVTVLTLQCHKALVSQRGLGSIVRTLADKSNPSCTVSRQVTNIFHKSAKRVHFEQS